MNWFQRVNQSLLLIGDFVLFYGALALTLYIRYGDAFYGPLLEIHLVPFTVMFFVWIVIFYIAGLYDFYAAQSTLELTRTLISTILIAGSIAMGLFYVIPSFGITPKTNLLIFIGIFTLFEYWWRKSFNTRITSIEAPYRVLLIGQGQSVDAITVSLKEAPHRGYQIVYSMNGLDDPEFNHLAQIILDKKVNLIALQAHIKKDAHAARKIYQNLALGIEVINLADLYETLFKRVPLAELEEVWFLENLIKQHRIYETIKRPVEAILATVLFIILSPLLLLIVLLIRLTSRGASIYTQTRVGGKGKQFTLYKFRTMRSDAEAHGPQWSGKDDARVTFIGKILRHTHLDELPQLLNIIKGNISFVGPRPERPEFVEELKHTIPYYEIRHLVKPGLTGWAQINYRYGSSINDAYQKLQYDIYYLKNRSILLDIAILTRTIKLFFINVE